MFWVPRYILSPNRYVGTLNEQQSASLTFIPNSMSKHPFINPRKEQICFTPLISHKMSQASRNKTCDKKFKTAELKVLKILSKIESLKLSNSYISRLDIPGEKREFRIHFHGKPKCYFLCFIISILLIGAWRIYSEIETKVIT